MRRGRAGAVGVSFLVATWASSVGWAGTPADVLLDKDGIAYMQTRDELLRDPKVLAAAGRTLGSTSYEVDNWLPLVLTEALVMHTTHAEDAQRLRRLRGLDPDRYRQHRRPVPSVARELQGLRHAAPLMIELFLKELDTYRFSGGDATAVERLALVGDLLLAIGASGHPAAVYFLVDVVAHGCACCESCGPAIRALGETGSAMALPTLVDMLEGAREGDDDTRLATTLSALGRLGDADAWPHIEAGLADPNAAVQLAAVRSAGVLASPRRRADDRSTGDTRRLVCRALVDVAVTAEDEAVARAALVAIGRVATPDLRMDLERQLEEFDPGTHWHPQAASRKRVQRVLDLMDRKLRPRAR